jgi:hypothetical protein
VNVLSDIDANSGGVWAAARVGPGRRDPFITRYLLPAGFLTLLIGFCVKDLWSSLFRQWFFSSDEYVVVAEVIRFVQLDFRQHFVDMPGTPFMLIGAAAWGLAFLAGHASGLIAASDGIGEFTFHHLPQLFLLLRAETLVFFCLSLVMLFWLTSWLVNRAAACVASLLLAMSPVYASYTSFVRVESLAVCLVLAAMLCLVYRDRRTSAPVGAQQWVGASHIVFCAGVLAGLAAATRLHSVTASMPVLVLLLLLPTRSRNVHDDSGWLKAADVAGWLGLVVAGALVLANQATLAQVPHARHLVLMALAGGAAALTLSNVLYWIPATRHAVVRVVTPDVLRLLVGCAVGAAVGMAPVLFQFKFLLLSAEMYSVSYLDVNAMALPFWEHVRLYVNQYLNIVAPDRLFVALLVIGFVLIAVRRDRRMLTIGAGALFFFFSKPLNIVAAPHHVILWLPFYALICSYPIGVVFDGVRKLVRWSVASEVVAAALVAFVWFSTTKGPALVPASTRYTEVRLHNILDATDWIKSHAEPNAVVAITYFCFNPDIFYTWVRTLAVPVPPSVLDGRDYIIWWGHQSILRGKVGWACSTKGDVESIKTRLDALAPGEGTDPFTDRAFGQVATFGEAANQVTVFRFDER